MDLADNLPTNELLLFYPQFPCPLLLIWFVMNICMALRYANSWRGQHYLIHPVWTQMGIQQTIKMPSCIATGNLKAWIDDIIAFEGLEFSWKVGDAPFIERLQTQTIDAHQRSTFHERP